MVATKTKIGSIKKELFFRNYLSFLNWPKIKSLLKKRGSSKWNFYQKAKTELIEELWYSVRWWLK